MLLQHLIFVAVPPPIPIPPSDSGEIASSNGTTPLSPLTKILPPLSPVLPDAPLFSFELLGLIVIVLTGAGVTVFYKIKSNHPEIKPLVVTVEIRGGEAY